MELLSCFAPLNGKTPKGTRSVSAPSKGTDAFGISHD